MLEKIRTITEDLQALHTEISNQMDPGSIGHKRPLFDEANAMELVTEFKLAIDQLRSDLWLYIQEFSKCPEADAALKTTHLLRATEMLRALTQHQQLSKPVSSFQEGSFFDRLHVVMEAYAVDYDCLAKPTEKSDR